MSELIAYEREALLREAFGLRLASVCHAKQRALMEDRSDRICVLAGRRSGKSHGIAARLLTQCRNYPNETAVAIALNRGKAWQIFGSALMRIAKQHGIKLQQRTIEGQLSLVTPWGSRIWIAGCDNKSEVDKFRGDRLIAAAIDEADSLRHYLGPLVEDSVGPALEDLGGWLSLSGTPGAVPDGYFYEASTGALTDWSLHSFDVRDNPFMPDPSTTLEKAQRRLSEATYRREWLGQWTRDDEALIYQYDAARNGFRVAELPQGMRTIIGIDLGYVDACAWAVIQYTPGMPNRYIVHTESQTGLSPSRAAALTEKLKRQYPGCRLVADVGGLGKGYAVEWASRYGIFVETAQKQSKAGFISMMSGDLRAGTLKIDPYTCGDLLQEWELLQWNEDRTGHDERCQNHLSDAALYAWRAASGQARPEVLHSPSVDDLEREAVIRRRAKRGEDGHFSHIR